ncbi:hypothetical protein ACELLULO517_21850 [Acidisoma cellulosilytica]|uniref:Uncharacterized protein n=1 Tax=Acidisoma cellulosilyticum TaxID=2802395 RepID=A0A963Z5I7_9PROT|nr:hypothetical protein [Acidisoma cellulosilyticum]MCB8882906.1 hypothetical protein [Acidisoma cellulosilyticum]
MIRTSRPWFDCDREAALMAMLSAGVAAPAKGEPQGLLRHFIPRRVRNDEFALFSSCSAMPLLDWAYETCEAPYHYVINGQDRGDVKNLLVELKRLFHEKLLKAISAPPGTKMLVASSPADAFRIAAMLFTLACDGEPMRWLAPSFGELGSDVPAGMRGHVVRPGEDHGDALLADNIEVVEISLRQARGEFIDDADIAETYRRHQRASGGRSIGLLTFGDATGAAGPLAMQADMIDATQMRVRASRIADFLKLGYPTVISGSTFLGGPLPSGALLVPPNTFGETVMNQAAELLAEDTGLNWKSGLGFSRGFGNMLRWMPGLHALEQFVDLGPKADIRMAQMTMELKDFLAEFPDFEGFESRHIHHVAFCGRDSGIVPFAVRRGKRGWMSMPELIGLYDTLAAQNVLLGLPITIGNRAALRLSLAAGDISVGSIAHKLGRLADALETVGFHRRRRVSSESGSLLHAARATCRPDGICLQ